MPEGDTIFRTARSLSRALAGQPVTRFRSVFPKLTRFHDETPLTGQLVESVDARGKWLLIHFSGGLTLATHMLMNGSWHIYRPGQPWQKPCSQMRIVLENANYIAVGFKVPIAEMHSAQSLARDTRIPQLSIDVLSEGFDCEEAIRRVLARSNEAIGDVLLDQKVLAGVGNVFKSEICFVTQVHPFAPVASLAPEQVRAVVIAAQKLVGANVLEDSGDLIVTYRGQQRRTIHTSDPSQSLWVYGRHGEPCRRCAEPIRRRLQGPDARVTFWCPRCQPMPGGFDMDG
jgi:endonuclease VIII